MSLHVWGKCEEVSRPHDIRIDTPTNIHRASLFAQPQWGVLLPGYHMRDEHLGLDLLKLTPMNYSTLDDIRVPQPPPYPLAINTSNMNTLGQPSVDIGLLKGAK